MREWISSELNWMLAPIAMCWVNASWLSVALAVAAPIPGLGRVVSGDVPKRRGAEPPLAVAVIEKSPAASGCDATPSPIDAAAAERDRGARQLSLSVRLLT